MARLLCPPRNILPFPPLIILLALLISCHQGCFSQHGGDNGMSDRDEKENKEEKQEEMLKLVRALFPRLDAGLKKGESGRIAVIGGSAEYTGAPYFAAISALKVGADIVHVFCPSSAASVIKAYSAELIVHPSLDAEDAASSIGDWLKRVHAVVLGPGLGRKEGTATLMKTLVDKIRELDLPLVIDADGLFFVSQQMDMVSGYSRAILTPNHNEFLHLYKKAMGGREPTRDELESGEAVKELAKEMGHLTVLQKGERDLISDGHKVLVGDHAGSPRRCGGQGDLTSGSLATLAYWALRQRQKDDEHKGQSPAPSTDYSPLLVASYAASSLTRDCAHIAYEKRGRSTVTGDLIDAIPTALDQWKVLW